MSDPATNPGSDAPLQSVQTDETPTISQHHPAGGLADQATPSADVTPQSVPVADPPEESRPAVVSAEKSPEVDKPAGRKLGEFRIIRELGRGGMGTVFEAIQEPLGRRVALKVLRGSAVMDDKAVRRFRREAESVARLHHPNIISVFSFGEKDGTYYYAMELVEGVPLSRVIRELRSGGMAGPDPFNPQTYTHPILGPEPEDQGHPLEKTLAPDPRDPASVALRNRITESRRVLSINRRFINIAVEMIAQVADALHHAHTQGVIHRDLKPGNLLLAAPAKLMLSDFGLAHQEGTHTLTHTGDFLGTPMYMSPEQAMAGRVRVDHRTDIYSLGVTLYELLTLQGPYAGTDTHTILKEVITKEPPSFRKLNVRLPRDLEVVTLKALEKDPDRRYQSAKDFADDLRRFLNYQAIQAKPPSAMTRFLRTLRRHQTNIAIGTAAGVVALLLVFSVIWYSTRQQTLKVDEFIRAGIDSLERANAGDDRRQSEQDYDEAIQNFKGALALDPRNDQATSGLRKLYLERCRRALERGDFDVARGILIPLRQLDLQEEDALRLADYQRRAVGTGSWKVETVPAGCRISLALIDENFQTGPPTDMGVSPLPSQDIAMGNYLVTFNDPNYAEVRYPMKIERNESKNVVVTLVRNDQIPLGMVYVPAGEFLYGDVQAGTAKKVFVDSFFIDRTEVTGADYEKFVQAIGAAPPSTWGRSKTCPARLRDSAVCNVSWFDAMEYSRWAGKRLPTEAEWEKAARGVDGRNFPWGNRFEPRRCNCRETYREGWHVGRWPLGASIYGCLDMAGNVWEWTRDREKPYLSSMIMRGGASYSTPADLLAYRRQGSPPAGSGYGALNLTGFRCAKSLVPSESKDVVDELSLRDDFAEAALLYGNQQRYPVVMKYVDRLLKLNPRSLPGNYWKSVCLEEQKKYSEALAALKIVFFQESNYRATPRTLPELIKKLEGAGEKVDKEFLEAPKWFSQAGLALRAKQYADAEGPLKKILDLDPENAVANEKMGELCQASGRMSEANDFFERRIQAFRVAIREEPGDAEAHNNFAWFLAQKDIHLDEGITLAKRALELDADNPMYWDTLAELLYRSKRLPEAITTIKQAIELDPGFKYYQEQLAKFQKALEGDKGKP